MWSQVLPKLLAPLLVLLTVTLGGTLAHRRHTNNWAVVVDTSRFWSNYRHIANALSLYHSVKRLGIPDSQIILMLADQMPCNARNCFPGQVFNSRTQKINLYGNNVEVDYRGAEVSVDNFITVLTGRHKPGTPASKKLDTDENSNIFIFMTGHGGDGFLKFQDFEELSSQDIADSIQEMHVKKRYHEIFFMVDTCQAGSLSNAITSPNVVTIGSSQTGESSYAHHSDNELGLAVIDRFTFSTLDYLQQMKVGDSIRNATLRDLFDFYNPRQLFSTPDYRADILGRPIDEVPVTDFFGSVLDIYLHYDEEAYPLDGEERLPLDGIETIALNSESSQQAVKTNKLTGGRDELGSTSSLYSTTSSPERFQFSTKFLVAACAFCVSAVIVTNKNI